MTMTLIQNNIQRDITNEKEIRRDMFLNFAVMHVFDYVYTCENMTDEEIHGIITSIHLIIRKLYALFL